jgi:hypothetical protein
LNSGGKVWEKSEKLKCSNAFVVYRLIMETIYFRLGIDSYCMAQKLHIRKNSGGRRCTILLKNFI